MIFKIIVFVQQAHNPPKWVRFFPVNVIFKLLGLRFAIDVNLTKR
jgi:hypothetical protein